MEIRETIGIALLVIGFITSFFIPAGTLLIFLGAFIYGKNRLALILLVGGLRELGFICLLFKIWRLGKFDNIVFTFSIVGKSILKSFNLGNVDNDFDIFSN